VDRTACTDRLVRADAIAGSGRIACLDVPALPLQLLLRREPEWRQCPAAVVTEDNPLAPLLWVNEVARRAGVLPGMRYAAALALDRNLRAATVADDEIAEAVDRLHRHLLRYSPRVEPARHEPGVFWLDAGGLERLSGTPEQWALRLHRSLKRARFVAGVAVGFSRFGSYCLARVQRRVVIITSVEAEATTCRRVPLARLELEPRLRDDLDRLGLCTVGDLITIPVTGLAARFGPRTAELVQLAQGLRFDPLQPVAPRAPDLGEQEFDEPEADAWRLLFVIKRLLHPLLSALADRQEAVALLQLDLVLADRAATLTREELRPAAPTLDVVLLMELVRLRLETMELSAGVERLVIEAVGLPAPPEALELFRTRPRRDREAALRAVARVRAELGDEAVVRAELQPSHLPESSFRWRQVEQLPTPAPLRLDTDDARPLVRRLLPRPRPLLAGSPDLARRHGLRLLRAAAGPMNRHLNAATDSATSSPDVQVHGPHLLSGGWWSREVRRVYHFLEDAHGQLLWVFYDEARGRWYLHGKVE